MPSSRKFYKTTYTVTVISESPIPGNMELSEVLDEGMGGDYSVAVSEDIHEIDGLTAAKELAAQHSDPEFFGLDAEGEDLDT